TASPAERQRLLCEAEDSLRRAGDRLELAYTLADLSRAHRDCDEHGWANRTAYRAYRIAASCGARALCAALLPLLRDAHSAVGSCGDGVGVASLSDGERRVADLAAAGYTNREIAKSLYVTVSTVEQHLTHVYRKLMVSGRAGLSAALDADESD